MRSSIIAEFAPAAPIAVALGDPAGIGPEIVAAAYLRGALPTFFAIGNPRALNSIGFGRWTEIASPADAAAAFGEALPVLSVPGCAAVTPGQPLACGAREALDALELAVGLTREGAASALVTAPVSKAELYAIGFHHPGQTEFVAERCGIAEANTAMLLVSGSLRVSPVTIHLALRDVPDALTIELIVARGRVVARALLRDFGIVDPRIAVAGLNPHGGEGGALGREEIDVIAPAVALLRDEGVDAFGPLAADTMFDPRARANYDVALCMYHDQALIPLKTLAFDEGVNVTAGLPIVRTAPDHGTAFGIAGKGAANPGAMIAAIRVAAECARARAGV